MVYIELTYEDKLIIYSKRLDGEKVSSIASEFNIASSTIKYLIRLANAHGTEIFKHKNKKRYLDDYKLEIINNVVKDNESIVSVAIKYGLSSPGILCKWVNKFIENGNTLVNKKITRGVQMTKNKSIAKATETEKIKSLKEEVLYLKAENEYLKKLSALVQQRKIK